MLVAGLVLFLVSPRNRPLVSLILAGLALGAMFTAVLAVTSGNQLAKELRLGDRVATHESRGGMVRLLCIVLAVGLVLLAAWQRSSRPQVRDHAARWMGGSLLPVALVATLAVIGTGHSGSKLVWEDAVVGDPASGSAAASNTTSAGNPTTPSTGNGGSAVPGDAAPQPTASPAIEVVLGEWTILTDMAVTAPGSLPFRIRNAGARVHTLRIRSGGDDGGGGGGDRYEWRSGELQSGETVTETVELPAGSYELTCSIEDNAGDHADLGMVGPFTVRAGAPVPTSPPVATTATNVPNANPANPASPQPVGPVAVAIRSFAFEPATATVAVGQSVVWTNEDPAPHTAAGDGFDTGSLARGAAATLRFDRRGRFNYICDIHPAMTGTVVVQ